MRYALHRNEFPTLKGLIVVYSYFLKWNVTKLLGDKFIHLQRSRYPSTSACTCITRVSASQVFEFRLSAIVSMQGGPLVSNVHIKATCRRDTWPRGLHKRSSLWRFGLPALFSYYADSQFGPRGTREAISGVDGPAQRDRCDFNRASSCRLSSEIAEFWTRDIDTRTLSCWLTNARLLWRRRDFSCIRIMPLRFINLLKFVSRVHVCSCYIGCCIM